MCLLSAFIVIACGVYTALLAKSLNDDIVSVYAQLRGCACMPARMIGSC
jgi:hypothetical protein